MSYFDGIKQSVVTFDLTPEAMAREKIERADLESALKVLKAWFPPPLHIPHYKLDADDVGIMDAAFWRYEAVKQLHSHLNPPKKKKEDDKPTE